MEKSDRELQIQHTFIVICNEIDQNTTSLKSIRDWIDFYRFNDVNSSDPKVPNYTFMFQQITIRFWVTEVQVKVLLCRVKTEEDFNQNKIFRNLENGTV